VDVVVSPEAVTYVDDRGGTVYVRSHQHRCCGGPLTLLDITTEPPADADGFSAVDAGDVVVRYQGDPADGPHVLTIELHGIVRRRLMAYWDGCAYRP